MSYINHMQKLLDVYQWGKYVKIYAVYKLISTNNMTRSTVQTMVVMPMMMITMPQPDYIYLVSHLAESVNNALQTKMKQN